MLSKKRSVSAVLAAAVLVSGLVASPAATAAPVPSAGKILTRVAGPYSTLGACQTFQSGPITWSDTKKWVAGPCFLKNGAYYFRYSWVPRG